MAEIKKNGGAGGKSSSGVGQFACSNTAAGDLASPDKGAGYFASSDTAAGYFASSDTAAGDLASPDRGAGYFASSDTAAGDLASPDRGAGYFASSNTAAGFRSDFEGIFGGARRIIVLKGGPGTGKSAFLRAAATAAEAAGRRVERFYCSSDPASLDGILADGELAIVDGTAPHVWEPKLPGALEEIVNLGQFWSGERLRAARDEIEALGAKKAAGYRLALLGLRGQGEALSEGLRRLEAEALLREKTEAAAGRLIRRVQPRRGAGSGGQKLRHIETVGMRGRVRLPGLSERASAVMLVPGFCGSEGLFLEALRRQALDAGLAVTVSMAPLLPDLPNALLFEESGLLILAGEPLGAAPVVSRVNMRRFFGREESAALRPLLRELRAASDGYAALTRRGFSQMREAHFALEALYGAAMDFPAKERFQTAFIASLFA